MFFSYDTIKSVSKIFGGGKENVKINIENFQSDRNVTMCYQIYYITIFFIFERNLQFGCNFNPLKFT